MCDLAAQVSIGHLRKVEAPTEPTGIRVSLMRFTVLDDRSINGLLPKILDMKKAKAFRSCLRL